MSGEIVEKYYRAFNAGDHAGMLALLSDDVAHDINQGAREIGRDRFAAFLAHMKDCYREQLEDIVILSNPDGTRVAAEFTVLGTYLKNDEGLPPAVGQHYRLPAGAFFELRGGTISRVTMYYNLNTWLSQVVGS
jgi:steroid delta-isomerase-like uncharacterized protein